MDSILLDRINREALSLFNDTAAAFKKSANETLNKRADYVPKQFIDNDKKIRIVFAGQYSAGKSSILSIITGQQLEVGQGVTTSQCNFLNWNGIEVVDTPGIHTQKRPDHDEITYQAMAEADLIVFVCTAEGFSEGLGKHFRKLLVEKGKGNEMMLVFNKMESSRYGNTPAGREAFIAKDVIPVISPEFTPDDLYVSYIDVYAYEDAQDVEGDERDKYLEMSGFKEFYQNMNRFIQDKKVLGKCTTSLYQMEQMLYEAMSECKTGDFCDDGAIQLLNQQRKALVDARENVKSQAYNTIRQHTQTVRNWGYEIANNLSSTDKQEKVNQELKEKYEATETVYSKAAQDIERIINTEVGEIGKVIDSLESSEFARQLRTAIEQKIGQINMSEKTYGNFNNGANAMKAGGEWLAKFAAGKNAKEGWNAIFKLGNYAGSDAHQMVLKVGHYFGHKFKPWEAVKMAGKIGKCGKILGVGGALLGVGLQLWQDQQDEKLERQMIACRSDIRNTFGEAANVIEMQFDENTNAWIESTLSPEIQSIDAQINEIESSINNQQHEYHLYHALLERTRTLISELQQAS